MTDNKAREGAEAPTYMQTVWRGISGRCPACGEGKLFKDFLGFANHIYGSTFFMATGFHGFHVIVGTIFLIVCLFRALQGHFTPKQHFGFEAAAWYWHFVDVVWLFLFSCIYVWGAGTHVEVLVR